jgi:hypothetical protein
LNSNNGIEFIFLWNLFELLQISEGLNITGVIQINLNAEKKMATLPLGEAHHGF